MNLFTGLVLAGGQATRMGRINKGLLPWGERNLAEHACDTLRPLCREVYVSANADLEHYRAMGPVIEDGRPHYGGPLVAIESALKIISTPWLLTLPCDTPFITTALIEELIALKGDTPHAAYAVCGDAIHPLVSLVPVTALPFVQALLDRDDRRVMNLWRALDAEALDLGLEREKFFRNLNTLEDYEAALQAFLG